MKKGELRLVRRDADKAYVSDMLWLPKRLVAEKAIKESLQFWDVVGGNAVQKRLWDETKDHIICPREYLKPEQYPQFPFPFIDLTPRLFPKTQLSMKHQPRDNQVEADASFKNATCGVLNLACGKGKTYLALRKIAEMGCPGLIVVHNSFLMQQWQDAIKEHVELPIGEKVGIIQGDQFDWEHPLTIAMIHTLSDRSFEGKIPPEFGKHFGVVVYDEVHHLSAPVFVRSANVIPGRRYGLSATVNRLDGTEFIYFSHIGPVFHSDLEQDLMPRVYFQHTPVYINLSKEPKCRDVSGEVSIPKIRSFMADFDPAMDFRYKCLKEAYDQNRKILAIGHSKEMLIKLHELFHGSGIVIAQTPQAERTNVLRKSQITFAIHTLGVEGLDDDNLDTLFILTPFTSPNDLQQVLGRVQRWKAKKSTPVVIIFEDQLVPPFKAMCRKLKGNLKEKNIPYTTLDIPR